jgi:23S rRNA (adenine2030-N6)-methyltransferase
MLSYQHIYHAGNLADMHKHSILSILLDHLIQKDKPLHYMETHAGAGYYDLNSKESLKTAEAKEGILKYINSSLPLPYKNTIAQIQSHYGQNIYPGSPLIAKTILRETDELSLMELHPAEFEKLKQNMYFKNVHIHKRDGYSGVLAITPPKIRRGVILIDPPYEVKDEYKWVVDFISKVNKKWAEAVIVLWYPILKEGYYKPMVNTIADANYKNFYKNELLFKETSKSMLGSGILIINTPYGVESKIK